MASESQNQSEGAKKIALFVSMLESDTLASLLKQLNDSERLQVIETYRSFSRQLPADMSYLVRVAKSLIDRTSADTTNCSSKLVTLAAAINNVSGTDIAKTILLLQEQSTQQQALVNLGSELSKLSLVNILA